MRHTLFIIIAFCVINSTCSQADKSTLIATILKRLDLKIEDVNMNLIVKKVMSYSPDKSVVVIPKIREKQEGSISYDAFILLIDTKTNEILSKFYEPKAWISDAIGLEKIDIDFAPYILSYKIRAFGIRVLYEGSSRPNPYENEDLSLFIPQKDNIVRVLKEISVNSTNGDWDTNCEGEFLYDKKVLIMSDKSNNGFYDIIVKDKSTRTIKRKIEDDCRDEVTVKNSITILHYDGKKYK